MALVNSTSGVRATYGYDSAATTYDGPNEALDISSALDTLRPTDVPLLTLIGRDSLRDPCVQVKHEWLEDETRGMSSTTTDNNLDDATEDAGNVITLATAGDGLKFRGAAVSTGPCDIIRIYSTAGSELAVVTGVSGDDITITRGYFTGSDAVNHTGYTKYIEIVGTFQPQGSSVIGASRTTIKANRYNYTQIFEDTFRQTATQRETRKWTRSDDRAYEVEKLMETMGVQFERTLIHGAKIAPSASTGGAMDGIIEFVAAANTYDKNQAILAQSHLEDALQAVWAVGARSSHAFVNAAQKRRINQLLDPYRQAGYNDEKLGTKVGRYETDFGDVTVVLDRHMPNDQVLIIDSSRIGFGPMSGRALGMSKDAANSTREVDIWQMTAEYTCEVRQPTAHALILDLATSGF